ncbi:MAG: hypothetical protein FWE37_02905 [Spirochaetaceae bacterium]|nr:hypothetical protein [Spirochaetaceae bacterium]
MKKKMIIGAVFSLLFLLFLGISLVFMGSNTEINRRVLFFYNDVNGQIVGNAIGITGRASKEQNIEALTDFLLTLPLNSAELRPILGAGGEVFLVSLVDSSCFIDIRLNNLAELAKQGINFRQDFELIEKTILFNFPALSNVNITINGAVPYQLSFTSD